MKKAFVCFLVTVFILCFASCSAEKEYKIEFAGNYDVVNELKEKYSPGEEVMIQLPTITEHYYDFYVNGVKIKPNDSITDDWTYTYYTFTMPAENVLINIEDRYVELPWLDETVDSETTDRETNDNVTERPQKDSVLGKLSEYLDTINMVEGLSQSDFISQVKKYNYNGESVTEGVLHYDGEFGGGCLIPGEYFYFENDFQFTKDYKYADYYNLIDTRVQLDGLEMPYGINFGDPFEEALEKIGIEFDPDSDFAPDENSDTDMTLYRDGNSSLVFKDMYRFKDPADFEFPYVLVYTETYSAQRDDGRTTEVKRKIELGFDMTGGELGSLQIRVDERWSAS